MSSVILDFLSSDIPVLISGIFLLIMGLIMKTDNLASSMIFKVIPFFLGATLVFNALY